MARDISNSEAAGYGLLVMHAMDMYRVKISDLAPSLPQAAVTGGWQLLGHIIGNDHLPVKNGPIRVGGPVCYGYVAQRGTEIVAAIRGTDQYVEWVEDAEFLPNPYEPLTHLPASPPEAKVEAGFWSIYKSMTLRPVDDRTGGPLHQVLESMVPEGSILTVTGHSLGAPLASYLTLELVRGKLGQQVAGCFFASPHPGNQAFATYFDKTVQNYRVFNYILDIVPRVPFGSDYTHLPKRTILRPATSEASIKLDVGCNHHVICYSAMLDYGQAAQFVAHPPPGEEGSATCVLGPEVGRTSLAKLLLTGIGDVAQV